MTWLAIIFLILDILLLYVIEKQESKIITKHCYKIVCDSKFLDTYFTKETAEIKQDDIFRIRQNFYGASFDSLEKLLVSPEYALVRNNGILHKILLETTREMKECNYKRIIL